MRVQAEQKQEHFDLIPVESVNAIELFTGKGLEPLLQEIEKAAAMPAVDVSTDKGRKDIASMAYKVARSKTTIDDAGKTLVATWKKQAAEVDAGRKKARDFLDELKDRVRKPLTDWETEQARIEEEKRLAVEAERAEIAAAAAAELERRERIVAEKEADIARQEAERLARERKEREEAARKAREEKFRQEAEASAKRDAEAALKAAQEATERAEQAARDAEERGKRQAEEAAERERLRASREAADREALRQAAERKERQEEAARAADKANRSRINGEIISALETEGIGARTAEKVVGLIATGAVPHVSIRY